MTEPIVTRESIRNLAQAAAKAGEPRGEANPFPAGTGAAIQFDRDYNSTLYAQQAEQLEGSGA